MNTLIILNDPPYGTERNYNGLRLAKALSNTDTKVTVFLLADAVVCAKHGQKVPQGFYNIELMLKSITRKGEVLLCGACMDARGLTDEEIIEGAQRSNMGTLAEHTLEADKVLVFDPVLFRGRIDMTPTHTPLDRLVAVIRRVGAETVDSEDARLQKTLLVGASLMFILAGLLWGGIYIAFDEPLAGAVPLSYAAVSLFSILLFGLTHHYRLFRVSQLLLILILPFLLQLALGGFVNSSAAILWSLICPFGALLIGQRHHAPWWFLAFLGLVIVSGLIQPDMHPTNNLPPWLVTIFFVANIGTVSAVAFILLHYFVGQESRFLGLLRLEQEKSERLLQNVLPKEIAAILKDKDETIAEHYDSVSILFADIADFTALSDELSPTEMVDLLNEVFSRFDSLVTKYSLEKIRTIGDNYMVVSGAPRPRPDHARLLARLALEMHAYVEEYQRNGRRLNFHIGIGSGPVRSGPVRSGDQRRDWPPEIPLRCLGRRSQYGQPYGKSQGVPGKIQITQDTYELLKDACICVPRGTVLVKGKGEMETWFLEGIKAGHE